MSHSTDSILSDILQESLKVGVDEARTLRRLREILQTRRVIELEYDAFTVPEPNFVTEKDRRLFHLNREDVMRLRPWTKGKLRGYIAWIKNASFDYNVHLWCYGRGNHINNLEPFRNFTAVVDKRNRFKYLSPFVTVPDHNTFQHFMDRALPRLMQGYIYLTPEDTRILVQKPSKHNRIVMEIYQKLGFKKSQLLFYNGKPYHAEAEINTCVAPLIHRDLWELSRTMLGVPEHLQVPVDEALVVLLSRTDTRNGGRRILNQDSIFNLLCQRYRRRRTVVFHGPASLSETLHLFSRALIIVGVHGGAFYNMNFSPRGTHIIEIVPTRESGTMVPDKRLFHVFWEQASLLRQVYWRISEPPRADNGDVMVSESKLSAVLDRIDQGLEF